MSTAGAARPLQRAVVTGGAGFIGSHLCERLIDGGVAVECVDNMVTGNPANVEHLVDRPGFRLTVADVVDGVDIDGPVDMVLHLACPASPVDYLRLPLETLTTGTAGTRCMLELARDKQARFLMASTSEVYGDPLEHPQRETYWGNVNPIGPRSVYDEAKRASEAYTMAYRRAHGLETRIARIFNTYGPRMRREDGRAVPAFVTQALAGEPLTVFGDGSQTRSLCYVDDLVEGLLRLARSDHDQPVNLGNPEEVTILELAREVRDIVGSTSPIEHRPLPVDDPRRRCPDIDLARTVLGWSPTLPLRKGLAKTVAWWRGHPAGAGGGAATG